MGTTERDQAERLVWSVEEASRQLGISRAHAYELIARGAATPSPRPATPRAQASDREAADAG